MIRIRRRGIPRTILVPVANWQTIEVRPGDNMSRIFKRAGLSARTLFDIMNLGPKVEKLRKIMPGEQLAIAKADDGQFHSLRYEESPLRNLIIQRTGDALDAFWEVTEPEVIIAFATAEISRSAPSLYHAGKKAGLSDNIIMELSYIFQWDISFALDLRRGDSFTLMYEEHYVDGEKVREGDIIAAHFSNMGRQFRAVAFEDSQGRTQYYAPDGSSMRKAFLRDPVHFSHVSSQFNLKRLHPVHKRVMPHRGIDYAANRGTPVRAAGDGNVTIARQNRASGKYIVIQHGQQYTTKYLHLSNFANGVRSGKRVEQGDVIGYVGATGWATGPHLHYEFLVNGVHRNPRTVALPKSEPIPAKEMTEFKARTSPLLARLDSLTGTTSYAQASEPPNEG
ncbi:MAG: peptidoglycan DD-metalloendopeptidase family protein [Gammaproteobacteria bacterium]|nr:peptidoglycan DD-metalloendopeptidase family protein [Gammaproteobacteria bacterium]